jgi:hypothetical protein
VSGSFIVSPILGFVVVALGVDRCCRPRKLKPEDEDRPEQLVPIRLEFDVEHHKMRDTFVWNLNGTAYIRFFFLMLITFSCPPRRPRGHT